MSVAVSGGSLGGDWAPSWGEGGSPTVDPERSLCRGWLWSPEGTGGSVGTGVGGGLSPWLGTGVSFEVRESLALSSVRRHLGCVC